MCDSCEAAMINGVLCHEHGCPDAWKDETRECEWCGKKFKPERRRQDCCCDSCHRIYYDHD